MITVNPQRLLETALALCAAPSPTCSARPAADRLAEILTRDGFDVERPDADWPASPAVVVRFSSGRPGPTLQFTGHLDTVHLPFVPPTYQDGELRGTGVSDMKGGISAAVEALRSLRETGLPEAGSILLTAYDLHEGPWGDSRQLHALLRDGVVGDGVLIPEYLSDCLPVVGRGLAVFQTRFHREGIPVHEVFRGPGHPDVIAAGSALVSEAKALDHSLQSDPDPLAGPASCFVGHIQAGEIYNQSPVECHVHGTRRWLPGQAASEVAQACISLIERVAADHQVQVDHGFRIQRDAFRLDETSPLVTAFQAAQIAVSGHPLPRGAKPFVDDGNSIYGRTGIPAITHGPHAFGAHTTQEHVSLDELVRVACVYAETARRFCV